MTRDLSIGGNKIIMGKVKKDWEENEGADNIVRCGSPNRRKWVRALKWRNIGHLEEEASDAKLATWDERSIGGVHRGNREPNQW